MTARARNLFVLLGASGLARVVLGLGTELYPDESYYLAWSRRPAFGYFDHPPMVAWLLWLLPPRLMGLLLGTLTTAAVGLLARASGLSRERALLAATLFSWLPLQLVLGTFALPDAPLMLFWTLALWALLKERWALASLCIGLAALSKYTGVFLAPIALAALWERRAFRWLAPSILIVLAVLAPMVLWNARHDWVSFRFQLHHGLGAGADLLDPVVYILGQLGATLGLAGVAGWLLARGRGGVPRVLVLAVVVPFGLFLLSSFRARVEVNWPSLAYPALVTVIAAQDFGGLRRWLAGAVVVGVALVVALTVPGPWQQRMWRPLGRLHGWSALHALAALQPNLVYTDTYQLASEVAAYSGLPATVTRTDRPSQYTAVWGIPSLPAAADALWVSELSPPPRNLSDRFEKTEELPGLSGRWGSVVTHHFSVFWLHRRRPVP